jgi:hypothetical protein
MRLTLHVGLKKTATTTLQHALSAAKAQLATEGLLVPGDPADHQRLARRVRGLGGDQTQAAARAALVPLVAEARQRALPHVLLSSEHLISVPAPAVMGLRDLLAQEFPEVTEIKVLAYVREPVGFATSMCQQGLKNGVLRLEAFYADPWPFTIADWLENYCRAFGRDNVVVRYFHPDHLIAGDIVRDFLDALGLAGVTIPVRVTRRNSALSRDGVLVADALAGLRPGPARDLQRRRQYRRLLEKIEGGRFVLPGEVQARVIAGSRADLARLQAAFQLDIRPEPVAESEGAGLSPDAALGLAWQILHKVEG